MKNIKDRAISGFTLLELLLSIGIFAVMSAFVATSIQNGIKAKQKVQTQIDEVSRMRDSLKLIERDINLAYHHLDWEKDFLAKVNTRPGQQQQPQPGGFPGGFPGNDFSGAQNQTQQDPNQAQRLDPTTHFVATESSLNFVTMNNARFQTNKKMADFVEVGYELKNCRSADGKTNSNCLWRRQTGAVDLDVTKGGDSLVLLENVTELKFRFLGEGKQDWVSDWNSTDQASDSAMKGKFPLAVEISMTTQKPGSPRKNSMQIVANLRFPNNPVQRNSNTNTGNNSGTGGNTGGNQNQNGTGAGVGR